MTRLLSKKQAIFYKTQKNKSNVALALVYALQKNGRLTKSEFLQLENATRNGRLFWHKKLTSKK